MIFPPIPDDKPCGRCGHRFGMHEADGCGCQLKCWQKVEPCRMHEDFGSGAVAWCSDCKTCDCTDFDHDS
jgi:hypothetical protein